MSLTRRLEVSNTTNLIKQFRSESENCTNVLLSNEPLVPTLAKLLLTNSAPLFPIDNVYSASKVGKDTCIDRIRNKYGKKCTFLMITSNAQTAEIAKKVG